MGAGSSKKGSHVVVAKTGREGKQNGHGKEPLKLIEPEVQVAESNMEKQDEKPTPVPDTTAENDNESSRGEGSLNQPTEDAGVVNDPTNKTTAVNNNDSSKGEGNLKQSTAETGVLNDPTKETMEEPVEQLQEKDFAALLTSFCEQYPDVKETSTKALSHFQDLKELLDSGNMTSPKYVELAKGFFGLYDDINKTDKAETRADKARLTDFTVSIGVPKLFCDTITHLKAQYPELTKWDRAEDLEKKETDQTPANDQDESQDKVDEDRTKELIIAQDTVKNLCGAILNFSDLHDDFCAASGAAGMVPLFVEIVKELEDSIEKNKRFEDAQTQRLNQFTVRGKMMSRTMGTLHNLSKRVPVRSSFSACGAVEVLIPFLKVDVTLYATKTLLILAYLIDEENNHVIMADKGPIKFLVNSLNKSTRGSNHRYLGWTTAELAEGLTQIALNDSNKKTIAEFGGIPILAKMLTKATDDQEKINGCNTLWTLAFDADNRKLIKDDKTALTELRKLASHGNSEIRKAASGALWEIEGKEKHSEVKKASAASAGAEEIADTKHIMISYQWDVQSSMVQLKKKLQAEGFKVWMDVDEMGGSTLESMAKAVENASVVLIGVSQKYKESPNCRSEAEYTFQLHRDIIPLMMEKKYKPDGWLGMVVGTKFWIDFTDRHKLDGNIDKLKRELGNRGSLKVHEHVQVAKLDVVDAAPRPSISSWKNSDAKKWIVDSGLQNRMNKKAVERLDGPMLIRLQDLRKESPEFYFSSVMKEFEMTSMFDVLELTDALDKLVG